MNFKRHSRTTREKKKTCIGNMYLEMRLSIISPNSNAIFFTYSQVSTLMLRLIRTQIPNDDEVNDEKNEAV